MFPIKVSNKIKSWFIKRIKNNQQTPSQGHEDGNIKEKILINWVSREKGDVLTNTEEIQRSEETLQIA